MQSTSLAIRHQMCLQLMLSWLNVWIIYVDYLANLYKKH